MPITFDFTNHAAVVTGGAQGIGRFVTVEEIAATIAFMVSDECSFTTGFTFDISGGRATY